MMPLYSLAAITLTWATIGAQIVPDHQAARLAAVSFAKANGFEFPTDSIVVARESRFGTPHAPAGRIDRDSATKTARAVAEELGPRAVTGSAAEVLACNLTVCSPATRLAVLLIGEPEASSKGVQVAIQLFSPGDQSDGFRPSVTTAVIRVERSAGKWVGSTVDLGPTKGYIRR